MRGDWICNLNIIMGWKIKSLGAHGTFVVNFIVAEDRGSFPQREEYPHYSMFPLKMFSLMSYSSAWHNR